MANPSDPPDAGSVGQAARPATYQDIISAMAEKQGIDPRLALAVAGAESNFKPDATSPKGALGIMQLMPETAQRLGVDPNDPIQNIRGGIAELKRLSDEHGGDVVMMLRRYNGSPDAPDDATEPYVRTVLGRLSGSSAKTASPPPGTSFKVGGPEAAKTAKGLGAPPPPALPTLSKGKGTIPPPSSTEARAEDQLKAKGDLGEVFRKGVMKPGAEVAKSVGSAFDPREQAGRRNLAGAIGATGAGFLTGGVGLAPAAYAALGAGLATGTEVSAERAITGQGEAMDAPIEAGKQAGLSLIGSGTGWILQGVGRLAVRSGVAKNAAASLSAESQAIHEGLDAGSAAYRSLVSKPASARAAGRAASGIREGAAKSTKELAGQAVEEAAATGPALKLEGARGKAQGIFDTQIKDLETYFSGKAAEGEGDALAGVGGQGAEILRGILSKGVSEEQRSSITAQLVGAGLPQDVAEATVEAARHPAAGVLRRIINAPEEVPFAAAHQFKRQLGEAVDWEHPAKKQVQQITKGVFQALRQDMAGHEPYNQATSRYQEIIPLFNKGFGKQILKDATEEPGRFVGRISPAKPEQVKMLRELLVDLPAEQGGPSAAAGLKAWNGVRSAWTYDKVIKGGVEKMGARIDKLTPDFVQEFYGDQEGQAILSNLKQIHTAWQSSAQAATDQQVRFLNSTLAPKHVRQPEEVLMDVLRATALGPRSIWGALATTRIILGGAGAADLVEWASRSPQATQLLVKAFTSPQPGYAVANLYRLLTGKEAPTPVVPPPGATVGQPPPR